jgi:hypothetical protein
VRMRLTLAALVAGLVAVPAARADAEYADARGDAGAAPDVTGVGVFNDAFERVVFAARIGGARLFGVGDVLEVAVDADRDAATGKGGWDYRVVVEGDRSWAVWVWEADRWVQASVATARAYFLGDVVVFGIDRTDLGNTDGFDFAVETTTVAGGGQEARDTAPDAAASWTYAPVPKRFGLGATKIVAVTRGGARAGRAFAAGYAFGRLDSPEPAAGARTSCAATAGSVRLAAKVSASEEAAACRVTLPKTAKGKLLKLTLTTTLRGKSVRKSFTTRIA